MVRYKLLKILHTIILSILFDPYALDGSFYRKHIMIEPVDMRDRAEAVMLQRFNDEKYVDKEKKGTFIVMEKGAAKELGRQIGSVLFDDFKKRFKLKDLTTMETFFTVANK